MLCELDLRPSLADDPGVSFEQDSFGGRHPVTKLARVRASARKAPPDTTSPFDDTFQETPVNRQKRLRECMREATMSPSGTGNFSRGVPTNDKTSSKNYDSNKIIDGEHKTLTILGKINEAMEDDDHQSHIYKHRLQLSDPQLSETRRNALLEHISDHVKKHGKKLKAVDAAKKGEGGGDRQDITKNRGYGHGVGLLSKSLPAKTNSVVPQDDPQSAVRKRTAGMISMEAREKRFDNAIRTRRRRGL